MENEEWRDVVGYEGYYQVSNIGRVKSVRLNCVMKQFNFRNGRLYFTAKKGVSKKNIQTHRAVAQAFIPNKENKPCIDHIDGNYLNNRAENLRWCTTKENNNNPVTVKRFAEAAKMRSTGRRGALSNRAIPIICIETDLLYWGACEAEREMGINASGINMVCKGRRKVAGGYHWKYATEAEVENGRKNN